MFGDGVTLDDLLSLFRAIRANDLKLQVKITMHPWEDLSPAVVTKMTAAILGGQIKNGEDIRLRLFAKS